MEVWASNAYRTDVLPISGDFNVNGGIHRPCHLIITGQDCITPLFYASPGVFIHQENISRETAGINVETHLSLKNKKQGLKLKTTIADASNKIVASNETGISGDIVRQPIQVERPVLWEGKKNPYLYTVTVELYDGNQLVDRMVQRTGFRYFSVDHEKGFFLNGNYLNLYGFCRHEDAVGGQAFTGLVDTEGFKVNARLAVKELVYQKFNHPSICFWGICNEILVSDGKRFVEYDNPIPFIKELNGLYKSIDTSRLTALATCVDQSYYLGCSDLIAWNKYFGWYKDAAPSASKFFDDCKNSSQGIPVGVSEYGGGASINHHQWPLSMEDRADSHFHPEEAQTFCHEGNWESFMKRPYLWAKFIWVFADFPSYMRQEGEEDGYNDKGLITQDRKVKKDAFYFYKANWNPEPMVYITSRRFVKRNNPQTDIKVFTNLKEVTLYINGKKIGTMKPDEMHRVIWKDIKLDEGRNTVRVEGKNGKENLSDSCEWYYIK